MTKALAVGGVAFLGIVLGMLAALIGGVPTLVLFALVAPLLLVLLDYRVGVAALTVLLPWAGSPLLPQAEGLNVINYLVLLSAISLVVPKLFRRQSLVKLPRPVIWLYLLPVTVGLIVAWPYIPQGAANLAGTPLSEGFTHSNFVKGRYLKPLGFVIYALMLANAVRDSKQPERWLIVLAASALLPTALVFGAVIIHGGDLTVVQTRREFLTPFGSHANEFGLLLMTACIPLLFVVADAKGAARFAWSVVLGLCVVGLTLTFSRGAWLGFLVAVVVFLIFQRKLQATLITIPIVLAALALAPQGVTDRLTTGFGEGTDNLVSGRGDHLSAGRVVSWRLLLPEVARSPIVGRGIGSTVWSSAVRDGLYKPIHPHSLYLAMAMDLGLVGLAALLWLQVKYLRAAWALARDDTLTTRMRAAFAGVAAMFVGVLVMGLTNNDFMPAPHQTYFWFFLGLLFAYWDRAQNLLRREAQTRAQVRVRGIGAGHGAFAGSAQRRGPSMASRTDS